MGFVHSRSLLFLFCARIQLEICNAFAHTGIKKSSACTYLQELSRLKKFFGLVSPDAQLSAAAWSTLS